MDSRVRVIRLARQEHVFLWPHGGLLCSEGKLRESEEKWGGAGKRERALFLHSCSLGTAFTDLYMNSNLQFWVQLWILSCANLSQ